MIGAAPRWAWRGPSLGLAVEALATAPWNGRLRPREHLLTLISLGVLVYLLRPVNVGGLLVGAGLIYAVGRSTRSPARRLVLAVLVLAAVIVVTYPYWHSSRISPGIEGFFLLRAIDFVRRPPTAMAGLSGYDRLGGFVLWLFFLPTLFCGPVVSCADFYRGYQPHVRNRRQLVLSMTLRIAWGAGKCVVASRVLAGFEQGLLAAALTGGAAAGWPALDGADPRVLAGATMAVDLVRFFVLYTGFTDVVIGVSRLLGFNVPENFDHPLLSSSPMRFWRASNITVYRWLLTNVFYPFWGHSRISAKVATTFFVSALWHLTLIRAPGWGAVLQVGLGFAIFAAAVIVLTWLSRLRGARPRPPARNPWVRGGLRVFSVAMTFSLVACAQWLVFGGLHGRPLASTLEVFRVLFTGQ